MSKRNPLLLVVIFVLALVSLSAFRPHHVSAQECGGPFPPKPAKVWVKAGPMAGEVTLYWDEVPYANRYAVAYGARSGDYLYGADNVGGEASRSYTVKSLTPGMKYYFRLAAARDCTSSPFSDEVSAWAMGGVVTVSTGSVGRVGAPVEKTKTMMPVMSVESQYLKAMPGPQVGAATLSWSHKQDVDNYHLVYGTTAGDYQYGALNIGKTTNYTVSHLVPGKMYYFALVPVKGDQALYTSDPVSAYAKAAVVVQTEVVQTKPEYLFKPKEQTKMPFEPPPKEIFRDDDYEDDNNNDDVEDNDVRGASDVFPPEQADNPYDLYGR